LQHAFVENHTHSYETYLSSFVFFYLSQLVVLRLIQGSRTLTGVVFSFSNTRFPCLTEWPCAHCCRWRDAFGIVFDIDGVLLRGKTPIEGASAALKRLHGEGPGAVHMIGRKAGKLKSFDTD
jgi:hypothetical protein